MLGFFIAKLFVYLEKNFSACYNKRTKTEEYNGQENRNK